MKNQKKIGKILFSITSAIFLFLFFFTFVSAFSYEPLSPLPGTTASGTSTVSSLGGYITGLYKIVIGISIVLAVVLFMVAGLEWMTAEAVGKKEDAIKRINAVLFGLLLTIGSWLFLNTINPNIITLNIDLKDVYINDTFTPDLYGWYCKNKDNVYLGPYYSESECIEKTECKGASVSMYCEEMNKGSDFTGSGGVGGSLLITDFFDTGIQMDNNFLKGSGPGFYYRYFSSSFVLSTPFTTAPACENERDKKQKEGANGITDACFFVKFGNSDSMLNMILNDETPETAGVRKYLTEKNISISRTKTCKYVGDTECTNLGGLRLDTINSIVKLKSICDDWAKKNKEGSCDIKINAGTEWWLHDVSSPEADRKDISKNKSNHKPVFFNDSLGRTIDIALNNTLDKFIKQKASKVEPTPDGYKYYPISGVPGGYYLLETDSAGNPNHWHVEF